VLVPQGAGIRRALCQEELLAAYRFVCKIRVSLGYPAPRPGVLWADPADGPRDLATFIAKDWPGLVAATSFVLDCPDCPLPADKVFPELADLRRYGRLLAELTNRVAVAGFYRTNVPNDLLRCCVAHGQFVGCSDLLAVARPWEQPAFEALGFERISPVRSSGGAVPEPVILVRLDLPSLQNACAGPDNSMPPAEDAHLLWRFYCQANPYLRHVKGWAATVGDEMRAGRIAFVDEAALAEAPRETSDDPADALCEPPQCSGPAEAPANAGRGARDVNGMEVTEESIMTTATTKSDMAEAPAASSSKADRMIRRVAFFRRMGLFGSKADGFVVERALGLEDYWQAYSLVHDCYVQRGYIEPCQGGARIRSFEAIPEMATFVAKVDDRVVAVTSVLMDSPELGLPSDKAFGPEIDKLRRDGRRVCEITNLAVHPDHRCRNVFSELTRCCLAHAMAIGYDDMFIAVSPEHARFFKEVFLFEPWGDRRDYSDTVEDIVVGMRMDLRTFKARAIEMDGILGKEAFLHDFYFARNTFHNCVQRWAIRAAGIFSDARGLHELFVVRGGLFSRLTRKEAAAIQVRWGDGIYYQVVGRDGEVSKEGLPLSAREGLSAA
jgi:ribosomal protein S18 acetylase RimI-like enzyme